MTVERPTAGSEGDTCAQCGSALAPDQRYCVNCGLRRGEARVDYQTQMTGTGQQAMAGGPAPAASSNQWSPVMAIGAIALLGVFLLLGVLIGKKDNNTAQTVAAQAAPTTTTAATPTTATTAAAPAKDKGGNKAAAAPAAGTAPGAGNVVQGGSGTTEGIQTADPNKSVQDNAKNGPDVVATGGTPEKLDPNGQAGGGSGATCIGC